MLHLMTVHGRLAAAPSHETARAEFIGRGRSPIDPQAMHRATLGDSEGAVLDPVVAIRNTVVIEPDETVRVHIVTGVAETRDGALRLIEKYSDRHSADRVFELSWTHSQVLLRRLDASEADTQLYDRLASKVLYSSPSLRAPRSVHRPQSARPAGPVGLRHLRRPADRAGAHRRSPTPRPGPPAGQGARLLGASRASRSTS
jgi:cyclic beta-1,2-glucan synthetase